MFAREPRRPLVALLLPGAALALLSEAVEVRVLQELLAAQPLGRVHPQTALKQTKPSRGGGAETTGWSLEGFQNKVQYES